MKQQSAHPKLISRHILVVAFVALTHDIKRIFTNPRFAPVVLLTLSIFFPWFTLTSLNLHHDTLSGGADRVLVTEYVYLPISILLKRTEGTMPFLVWDNWIFLLVPATIVLFWIPCRYSMTDLLGEHQWELDTECFTTLFLPALFAVFFYIARLDSLIIGLGFVFVVLAPIVWILEIAVHERLKQT
ncbi:MAG: hypothetical protein KGY80_03820 [Candidatus Thorarchaeota archaeon]|nr:hypothetical protein [Candidatus Thorarchaeota archaeon]